MRSGKWTVGVASVAALVSISAFAASAATVAPLVRVSGKSPYANCSNDDIGGVVYNNADEDPRVASSPVDRDNLVGAWEQDFSDFGGGRGIMSAWSGDGGASWHGSKVPFTMCNTPATKYTRAALPSVSIDAGGRAYVVAAVDREGIDSSSAAAVTTSVDGGQTWAAPKFVAASGANGSTWVVRATVAASPTVAGTAYIVLDRLQLHFPNIAIDTLLTKTTDGGAHWSALRAISAGGENMLTGHSVLVDPSSGAVYIVWTQATKSWPLARLIVSSNGGTTWSAPRTINTVRLSRLQHPVTGEDIVFGLPPDVAIDATTGALYATWLDARNTDGTRNEIFFSRSTNGGVSWSKIVRVSSKVKRPAFLPSVTVNAAGDVAVLYYDLRFMKAGDGENLRTDVWLRSSIDGGRTWTGDKHVGGPFNLRAAPKLDDRFDVGNVEGLTTNAAGNFVPFFVQTNCVTGGCPSNRTDVFASVVAP